MPTVQANATILVTGSNGFVTGAWIVDTLLTRGYNVRAAVRAEAKGQHLLETFKSYGDKLQICPVGDIAADGAFDEAVKVVEGIIHTAATLGTDMGDMEPTAIINEAVKGNIGIFTSALKHGTTLKRIVITSSCGARTSYSQVPKYVDENSWNDEAVAECEKLGGGASPLVKYIASKTLAEKAAWEWYEKHKGAINWDLTTFSPPLIIGPMLHDVQEIENINASNMLLYNAVVKGSLYALHGVSPLTGPSHGWIDVRDVAELHVRGLEYAAAANERTLILSGQFVWQDAMDAANSLSPSPWPSHKEPFAKGEVGEKVYNITWNVEKEKRIFGLKFRTIEETMKDFIADLERRGWS
ncbi:methylglyoxal reductase (NADPH-dependent) gre2 [Steccherinum ochraceum]|uniref:Methylglyoxal reductase (NADPH-dependent) gre2 n=1 Tax=Steccherinum ochraceum TaxID=92696 RepID=A0A4R0RM09_9APHY|nr:methylglyoxal reductase (NADPH-dependent) gre2 [Steccherinum ochraceum]